MKVRILVAEPDSFLAEIYSKKLGGCGYAVESCNSGSDCIQKYRQSTRPSDKNLIPSFDIIMINEDIETQSEIRIIDEILFSNPDQRMLVISSHQKDSSRHNVSIIAKPFSVFSLIQRIDEMAKKLENPYLNRAS